MVLDDLPSIDPNIDYTQILPIQQKRTVAFINHFIMTTVSFLNSFSQSCESRLMEFENKLQNIEASLIVLESQLSSISGLDDYDNEKETIEETNILELKQEIEQIPENLEIDCNTSNVSSEESDKQKQIKISEDNRYKKFFKMLQFGVPSQAVKLKMQIENVDPDILDNPNAIIYETDVI